MEKTERSYFSERSEVSKTNLKDSNREITGENSTTAKKIQFLLAPNIGL